MFLYIHWEYKEKNLIIYITCLDNNVMSSYPIRTLEYDGIYSTTHTIRGINHIKSEY